MEKKRDSFSSRWGFILAGVGSAVGCGNLWRFPIMVSRYGGLTYIIPYLIFVLLVSNSGVMEEFALGRAAKSGPIGAFGMISEKAGKGRKLGEALGVVPVIGSLGLAIGYTCVFSWVVKYTYLAISGKLFAMGQNMDVLGGNFGATASAGGNNAWVVVAACLAFVIMAFGISGGIEKANKVMMPSLFGLLIILAVYIATLPGAGEGYKYIFSLDPAGLANPNTWIYSFGMAFFSLSVAGNGSVIYGSYLKDDEDIPYSARRVALYDTLASLLATCVIIPAMAAGGVSCDSTGPGLIFIYLVNVFNGMGFVGKLLGIIFFVLFTFAALSSIVNMYEVSVSFLEEKIRLKRILAALFGVAAGCVVALFIQGIASDWMDVVNNYICPIGALLAAIMFYWVGGREFAEGQVNLGASKPVAKWFFPLGKYVFCSACVIALVAGVALGGIG